MGVKAQDVGPFEECFTHIHDTTGVQTTYLSERLFAFCEAHEDQAGKCIVPVEQHHAAYCIEHRGVEQERLRTLVEHPEYLKKPILFVQQPDGSHLLIDGTHRYVTYFMGQAKWIPAYVVPFEVAKDFIVEDAPQVDEQTLMDDRTMQLARHLRRLVDEPKAES